MEDPSSRRFRSRRSTSQSISLTRHVHRREPDAKNARQLFMIYLRSNAKSSKRKARKQHMRSLKRPDSSEQPPFPGVDGFKQAAVSSEIGWMAENNCSLIPTASKTKQDDTRMMDATFDNNDFLEFSDHRKSTSSHVLTDVVAEAAPTAPTTTEASLIEALTKATQGRPRTAFHASDPIPTELLAWQPPQYEQSSSTIARGLGEGVLLEAALLDALKEAAVGQPPRRYKASDHIPTDLLSWTGSTAPVEENEESLETLMLDALHKTKVNRPYKAPDPIPTDLVSWSQPRSTLLK